MALILYLAATSFTSSTSHFKKLASSGLYSDDSLSKTGEITLHGPHLPAIQSTFVRTKVDDRIPNSVEINNL